MKNITLLVILLLLQTAAVAQDKGQQAGDGGAPAFNNFFYDENGNVIFQYETQYAQMLRRGVGAKGFDPTSTGRMGRSAVIRLDNSALLVGKPDGGGDMVFYILGSKKDLGRFKLAYGGFGGIVAGSRQEAVIAGMRAAAEYTSKDLRIGPDAKANLKGRSEFMAQFNYDFKNKNLGKDISMIFEITPVVQIDNVLGGGLTVEFTTQIAPGIKQSGNISPEKRDIADFSAVNMMPNANTMYGAAGYERQIIPVGKVFSKVIIGKISKNAFIHTSAGYKHYIGNDGEITILIGYVDTLGTTDPALESVPKVYGGATYGNSKFQVNLSVQKSLIEYQGGPAANKMPQIRLRANMNLDRLAGKQKDNHKNLFAAQRSARQIKSTLFFTGDIAVEGPLAAAVLFDVV